MTSLPAPSLAAPQVGQPLSQSYLTNQMYNPLTFLLNPPQVSMSSSAGAAGGASAANFVMPWDTTDYDNYGGHSTTVNNTRYTCQVSGLYKMRAQVTWGANATGMRALEFWVNGSITRGGRRSTAVTGASTTGLGMEISLDCRLNAGDYVELNTIQWSGGTLQINGSNVGQTSSMQLLWVAL